MHWRWPESPVDRWVPYHESKGRRTWRRHYVVHEEDGTIRGACALKPHDWWVKGETVQITDWHGPITEGVIDNKFLTVGLRMIREMQKEAPLLYSWGHGGLETPMLKMLESMRFLMYGTPFCLRVLRSARFLRLNGYLRTTGMRRVAQDLLAYSGLGWLGGKLAGAWMRRHRRVPKGLRVEEFATFGPWADELWESVRSSYSAIAYRDAETMNHLLPVGGWPEGIRLRVWDDDRSLGWVVVLDTQMSGDIRFGDLRVGSIIDCFADPEDADAVIAGADAFLASRGVDCIMSNQAHPRWREAFARNGYLLLENRRFLAATPALEKLLSPFDEVWMGLHMTNLDGHGPMRM